MTHRYAPALAVRWQAGTTRGPRAVTRGQRALPGSADTCRGVLVETLVGRAVGGCPAGGGGPGEGPLDHVPAASKSPKSLVRQSLRSPVCKEPE